MADDAPSVELAPVAPPSRFARFLARIREPGLPRTGAIVAGSALGVVAFYFGSRTLLRASRSTAYNEGFRAGVREGLQASGSSGLTSNFDSAGHDE